MGPGFAFLMHVSLCFGEGLTFWRGPLKSYTNPPFYYFQNHRNPRRNNLHFYAFIRRVLTDLSSEPDLPRNAPRPNRFTFHKPQVQGPIPSKTGLLPVLRSHKDQGYLTFGFICGIT